MDVHKLPEIQRKELILWGISGVAFVAEHKLGYPASYTLKGGDNRLYRITIEEERK